MILYLCFYDIILLFFDIPLLYYYVNLEPSIIVCLSSRDIYFEIFVILLAISLPIKSPVASAVF